MLEIKVTCHNKTGLRTDLKCPDQPTRIGWTNVVGIRDGTENAVLGCVPDSGHLFLASGEVFSDHSPSV